VSGSLPPSLGITWAGAARVCAAALVGASLTYSVWYSRLLESRPEQRVPDAILLALSIILGGMLVGGFRWTRLLRPAGLLGGFLVAGHMVWGAYADSVSAAFVMSNWCELAVALALTYAGGVAEDANSAARR